jgi:histidine ammonia-lyase
LGWDRLTKFTIFITIMNTFLYGQQELTVTLAMQLAIGECKGIITDAIKTKVNKSVASVQSIVAAGKTVYGINTGFGPLCDTLITTEDTRKLQHNLLMSHAVGVGKPIETILAKLMLITKIQALCQGYSGVSLNVIERIEWHINYNVIPVVPEKGSVGASGDLAPLAHLFLPLIGYGFVNDNGLIIEAKAFYAKYDLAPLQLEAKEGLGLINGTQFILAHAVYGVYKMQQLLNIADVIGAMSLDAYMGSAAPFKEALHKIRPYQGTQQVAERLRKILTGSAIVQSHHDCDRVQDPYSLRCMPQVHGASRNAWQHLNELVQIELNSVTDNPIILSDTESISGGNFHGQPLAIPLDYATIAAAELGNISDRRCYLLLEGKYGLPKLLIKESGLNSGFMIPQYTTAALVTENKTLCFPASADSIPTSLGQEDHVSMGSISGRQFNEVLNNVTYILAIELLYASQALDARRPLKSSVVIEKIHSLVREKVSYVTDDRVFNIDIEAVYQLIQTTIFVDCCV